MQSDLSDFLHTRNYKFIFFVYNTVSIILMTTQPTNLFIIYIKMNLRINITHIIGSYKYILETQWIHNLNIYMKHIMGVYIAMKY